MCLNLYVAVCLMAGMRKKRVGEDKADETLGTEERGRGAQCCRGGLGEGTAKGPKRKKEISREEDMKETLIH